MPEDFTVHLATRTNEVLRIFERDESVAFGLVCAFIADYLRFLEARIATERLSEQLVRHLVAEISAENTIVA